MWYRRLRWLKVVAMLLDVVAAIILSGVIYTARRVMARERKIDDAVIAAMKYDDKLVILAIVLLVMSFFMLVFEEIVSGINQSADIRQHIREEALEVIKQLNDLPASNLLVELKQILLSITTKNKNT